MMVLACCGLLAAACADDEPTASDTTEATSPTPTAPATTAPPDTATDAATSSETEAGGAATVAVAASDLGEILVDAEGRTLYLFLNDEQGDPTCNDDCAQAWPPLEGPGEAGEGAAADLLGTVEREDGTQQVTYNDWPLYYFANDQQPGDTNGQGVGDVWFVVDVTGEPVS